LQSEKFCGSLIEQYGKAAGEKMSETANDANSTYPEKKAPADYPLSEVIARRWSPVLFDESRAVESEKILSLLEAARWAPSCYNDQPAHYLVFDGSDAAALEGARSCLVEGNAWARKAPLLLLSVARDNFAFNGKPNRHAHHDVGAASENLVLQAVELGLAAHQMAGYDADKARQEFSIPEDFTPMAMIAIGYPRHEDLAEVDEKTRARELAPRSRRPIREIAFSGKWGESFE
jgi:nitroreductase